MSICGVANREPCGSCLQKISTNVAAKKEQSLVPFYGTCITDGKVVYFMKIARILTAILVAVVEGTAVDDAVTDERVVDAVAVERVA